MYNPMDLTGKQYLVTGASSGVGRQICITLSKMGAKVIMTARNEERLLETRNLMEGKGHIYYIFDLNNVEDIEGFIEKIVAENGKLDGLVYCAGLMALRKLTMTTYSFMQDMMRVNVFAFVEIMRIVTKKSNCNTKASIVAISSVSSIRGEKAKTAYSATKGALDSVVQNLAVELGEKKEIRVNTINPGWIQGVVYNNYIEAVGEQRTEEIEKDQFLGLIDPKEIANMAGYLLSSAASHITGQSILVDGGYTIHL